MSSIAGFFQPNYIFSQKDDFCIKTIRKMSENLIHRGPDEQSFHLFPHGAFSQNFLLAGYIPGSFPHEVQPATKQFRENNYTILFDGFISNASDIAKSLEERQVYTKGLSLEGLLIDAYIIWGMNFIKKLRGAFALCLYDEKKETLYLYRDALGLRPLFYSHQNETLVFASEIKGLFAHSDITPALNREGLTELLGLGPARIPGSAIFETIHEVKPGRMIIYNKHGFMEECFHSFEIREHTDSVSDTNDHIKELLDQSINSLKSCIAPSACLLSGGLDSSVVTARLASDASVPLNTYSLEFANSRQHFKANAFQPALDAPYVNKMVSALGTNHNICICNNQNQVDYLKESVKAHDLPAMADVDSSYLYFCEKVGETHKIIYTGECADEIFCGYPWYHSTEEDPKTFPWSKNLSARCTLLKDDILSRLPLKDTIHDAYQSTCQEIGLDGQNTPAFHRHQKTFYLTVRYFMQTLVNRGDRAAAYNRMDARVPFAHQDLTEYLFNVPYEIKTPDGEVKHLLRAYASGLLTDEIRLRKKSPYPKTYDPEYETMVNTALLQELSDPNCPLHAFVDKHKVSSFCAQIKDLGQPWYGQLMAGPQLVAYYLQICYWLKEYDIAIHI
uniref:asparagine synthase (glutamine-hydrolyzing) n=1 Tax=Agathobacter sp. TaxID=2021311 RepID=UPI004055A487